MIKSITDLPELRLTGWVVPGLLMLVRVLLLPVIVSAENTSVMNPLEISRNMSIGRFWRFLGYALLFGAVCFGASELLLFTLLLILPYDWITNTFYNVATDYFYLLFSVMLTVLYLNIKTEQKDSEVVTHGDNDNDNENRLDPARKHILE